LRLVENVLESPLCDGNDGDVEDRHHGTENDDASDHHHPPVELATGRTSWLNGRIVGFGTHWSYSSVSRGQGLVA
jgi:hypothetical protein